MTETVYPPTDWYAHGKLVSSLLYRMAEEAKRQGHAVLEAALNGQACNVYGHGIFLARMEVKDDNPA